MNRDEIVTIIERWLELSVSDKFPADPGQLADTILALAAPPSEAKINNVTSISSNQYLTDWQLRELKRDAEINCNEYVAKAVAEIEAHRTPQQVPPGFVETLEAAGCCMSTPSVVGVSEAMVVSRIIMIEGVCGLMIEGKRAFCDDERANPEIRQKKCACKDLGVKVVAALAIPPTAEWRAKPISKEALDNAINAASEHIAPCGHNELGDVFDAVIAAFKSIGVPFPAPPAAESK